LFLVCLDFPFSYAALIFNTQEAPKLIFLWLFSCYQTDNGGLAFGKAFGKTPFAALISPNKKFEGFIGGYLLNFLSLVAICPFAGVWLFPKLQAVDIVALTLLVSTTATIGDLGESFFKRVALVKDSGNLIPGHGGILDRIDSIVLSAPVVYYYSSFFLIKL